MGTEKHWCATELTTDIDQFWARKQKTIHVKGLKFCRTCSLTRTELSWKSATEIYVKSPRIDQVHSSFQNNPQAKEVGRKTEKVFGTGYKCRHRAFPGDPGVKTLPSRAEAAGPIPGLRSHRPWSQNTKTESRRNTVANQIKIKKKKKDSHLKNLLKTMQTQPKEICGVQLRLCWKEYFQGYMLAGGKKGLEPIVYALTLRN